MMDAKQARIAAYEGAQEVLTKAFQHKISRLGLAKFDRSCPKCRGPLRAGDNVFLYGPYKTSWLWVCWRCAFENPYMMPVTRTLLSDYPEEAKLVEAELNPPPPVVEPVPKTATINPILVESLTADSGLVGVKPKVEESELTYFMKAAAPGTVAVFWYFEPDHYELDHDAIPLGLQPIIVPVPLVGMVEDNGSLGPVVVEPGTGKLITEVDCFYIESSPRGVDHNVQLLGYDQEESFDEDKWSAIVTESPEWQHWVNNTTEAEQDDYWVDLPFYIKDCPANYQSYCPRYSYDANHCEHCFELMGYIQGNWPEFYETGYHLYEFCKKCGCVFRKGGLVHRGMDCTRQGVDNYYRGRRYRAN
jgi:hypothetical protein